MSDSLHHIFQYLDAHLPGRVSKAGDERYTAATALFARPVGRHPRAIVHCQTREDVQRAVRMAREIDAPLSVRGGGHDWAGRSLSDGIVIDLTRMNDVVVHDDRRSAQILGGALASDVTTVTDPLGLAPVAGSVGSVGVAGLTLGGGYGALIGRFGLALDNLLAAEVVLADGRLVVASDETEADLFWALQGGGGNFGVVTAMHHRLHEVPSVRAGMLVYSPAEARTVLERAVELAATTPDALTFLLTLVVGQGGKPMVLVAPTWCGAPAEGEARLRPFADLGQPIAGGLGQMPYGQSLTIFDAQLVKGRRMFMDTCWLPALDHRFIEISLDAMERAPSAGCTIITHEFKGAASRVPASATAFGLRRDHVLVEIIASVVDDGGGRDGESDTGHELAHQHWARETRLAFDALALPGGYPNILASDDDPDRIAKGYGPNVARLGDVKRRYDPDNVFRSAIPLP